jgi:hypothetical protein
MSSALLILAIIAIWACVLVPRWIHKPYRATHPSAPEFPARQHAAPATPGAESAVAGFARAPTFADYGVFEEDEITLEHDAVVEHGVVYEDGVVTEYETVTEHETVDPDSDSGDGLWWHRFAQRYMIRTSLPGGYQGPPQSRTRILQARRRLLTMLVSLMLAAIVFTLSHLSPPWILVPTGGMLGMYLLLLRECAQADVELAQRRAAEAAEIAAEATAARAALEAQEEAQRAWEAQQPEPEAEVIDISARIQPQLYDQYSDAVDRAVGD